MNLSALRLYHQQISAPQTGSPGEIVKHLAALQAQDYSGAQWSIGLRAKGIRASDIDTAIRNKALVRTWPMRGTLHFVTPEDVRWMLKLLTPRIIAGMAAINRQKELDHAVFSKSQTILVRALEGHRMLTRSACYELLENNGISTSTQRGVHILNRAAMEGLICLGPHQDKQATFVLLDEWLPASEEVDSQDALGMLAFRYFNGHGPASLMDFVWWSGLKITDARKGLALVSPQLRHFRLDGEDYFMSMAVDASLSSLSGVYLLPGFDEYILGYKDRQHAISPDNAKRIVPGKNGVFMPTLLVEGRVAGIWKKMVKKDGVAMTIELFHPLSLETKSLVRQSAEQHCGYLEKTLSSLLYV